MYRPTAHGPVREILHHRRDCVALRRKDGADAIRAVHDKTGVRVYVCFTGDKPDEECPELQTYGQALVRALPLPVGYACVGFKEGSGYRSML